MSVHSGVGCVGPVFCIRSAGEEEGADGFAYGADGSFGDAVELVDVGGSELAIDGIGVAEFEEAGTETSSPPWLCEGFCGSVWAASIARGAWVGGGRRRGGGSSQASAHDGFARCGAAIARLGVQEAPDELQRRTERAAVAESRAKGACEHQASDAA